MGGKATAAAPGRRRSRVAAFVSFVCAGAASPYLLGAPTHKEVVRMVRLGPGAQRVEATSAASRTLVAANGPRVFVVLAVPGVLAGVPLLLGRASVRRPAAVTSAFLLGGFSLLTGFSVGLFYLPSALAMGLAALGERRASPAGAG